MRFAVVLAAVLAASGCDYTTINQYAAPETDGGVGDAGDDMYEWRGKFGGSTRPAVQAFVPIGDTDRIHGDRIVDVQTVDSLPRPVSVTLVAPLFGDPVTEAAELFAVITWGAGGLPAKAYVDVGRGCTINLVAASVQVEILQMMINGAAAPGVPLTPQCGAFAGPGPGAGHFHPTRTSSLNTVSAPGGGEVGFQVPPFARSLRIECSPAASTLRLRIYSNTAGGLLSSESVFAAFPTDDIPLPSDLGWVAAGINQPFPFISLENLGAANVDRIRVIFDLDM